MTPTRPLSRIEKLTGNEYGNRTRFAASRDPGFSPNEHAAKLDRHKRIRGGGFVTTKVGAAVAQARRRQGYDEIQGTYLHGENGDVALVEPSPEAYREKGRVKLPDQPKRINAIEKAWAYPVIAIGRLYIRDAGKLWCYNISKR